MPENHRENTAEIKHGKYTNGPVYCHNLTYTRRPHRNKEIKSICSMNWDISSNIVIKHEAFFKDMLT